jgi:hypothetical protein
MGIRPPQTHKTPTGFSWESSGNEEFVYPLVRRGLLRVDERGRVWRVGRVRPVGFASKRNKVVKFAEPTPADVLIQPEARTVVQARVNGKMYTCPSSRLVWMHAYGPIPGGMQVQHIDGDATNNAIENLRLARPGGIIRESCERNPERIVRGSRHARSKLTEETAAEILRRCRGEGEKQAKVARELGVTQSLVSMVVLRKIWKHVEDSAAPPDARRVEEGVGNA